MPKLLLFLLLIFTSYSLRAMEQEPVWQAQSTTGTNKVPQVKITVGDNTQPIEIDRNVANLFTTITNTIEALGETGEPIYLFQIDSTTMKNVIELAEFYIGVNKEFSLQQLRSIVPNRLLKLISALNYLGANKDFFDASMREIGIILSNTFTEHTTNDQSRKIFEILDPDNTHSEMYIPTELIPQIINSIKLTITHSLQKQLVIKNKFQTTHGNNTIVSIDTDNNWQTKIVKTERGYAGLYMAENKNKQDNPLSYGNLSPSPIICPIFDPYNRYIAAVANQPNDIQTLHIMNMNQIQQQALPLEIHYKTSAITFNNKKDLLLFFSSSPQPLLNIEGVNHYSSKIFALNPEQPNAIPLLQYTMLSDKITALACNPSEDQSTVAVISFNQYLASKLSVLTLNNSNQTTSIDLTLFYDCSIPSTPQVIFLNSDTLITATLKNNKTIIKILKTTVSEKGVHALKDLYTTKIEGTLKSINCDSSGKYIAALVAHSENNVDSELVYLYTIDNEYLTELAQLTPNQQRLKDGYTSRKISFIKKEKQLVLFAPFWQQATFYPLWSHEDIETLTQLTDMEKGTDRSNGNLQLLTWLILYKIYVKNLAPSNDEIRILNKLVQRTKDFLKKFEPFNIWYQEIQQSNTQQTAQNNIPPAAPQPSGWWSRAQSFVNNLYNRFSQFSWRQKAGAVACTGAACAVGAYALYKTNMLPKLAK